MNAEDKTWVKVALCADIPPREGRCVEIAGRSIAIFHTSEGFLAVEGRCPHRGGPLADGIVSGTTVVCPLHAWKFDLHSGASINHPDSSAALTMYPTCIQDGVICIEFSQSILQMTSRPRCASIAIAPYAGCSAKFRRPPPGPAIS